MKRCIRWLARLYPAEWRMRYGAEFDVLLDDATLQWRDLADVIRGAAIMQMTGWMSYWKMALLAGMAGAILAGGWSFTLPNQYLCTAALAVERRGATQGELARALSEVIPKVLGRDNLTALIKDPQLSLYPKERQRLTLQGIAEDTFRKHVRITPLPYSLGPPDAQAFRIVFQYPDRFTARAVVIRLTEEIQQHVAQLPDPPALNILEQPILPQAPTSPVRSSIAVLGMIAGALLGLLSLRIWRRTRTYAVVTLSIPKDTKQFADSQVAAGHYRDVGEYVRELIRADEKKRQ